VEVPVEIIDGPTIVAERDRHCVGIRLVTPFRGMFAVRDLLMEELYSWADARVIAYGHTFFRLHVVDMGGPMDVEVGVITGEAVRGDGRIRTGRQCRHFRTTGSSMRWTRSRPIGFSQGWCGSA
jgi:hypothetical protein